MNNKEYNIIFLDIDGVLNGYNTWNLLGWKIVNNIRYKPLITKYKQLTGPFGIHECKVKRLAKIVNATNAKIVMSSSWRHGWWNTPYEKQYDDYKQLTDLFNKYNIDVIDITPTLSSGARGEEICKWLHENKQKVRSFIILDDESCDMYPFKDSSRFIQTKDINNSTGLKRKHVKPTIEMLQFEILSLY